MAREHVERGRPAARVGDVVDLRAGLLADHLVRHVGDAAVARQPQADRVRPRLGAREVGAEVGDAGLRVDHQDLRVDHRLDHRREGLLAVVGQAVEQDAVERQSLALLQQRVAVGRRLGHARGADGAAGAPEVLDHHRLAPALGQALGDQAGELVGAAAGGHRHHDVDRLRGETGRLVGGGAGGSREGGEQDGRGQRGTQQGAARAAGREGQGGHWVSCSRMRRP